MKSSRSGWLEWQGAIHFVVAALLAFTSNPGLLTAGPLAKPNVVFILADDTGPGDFSCCGRTRAKTPVIDRLAAEGIRFTQFTVAAPICSPSRVAFTTGQYPARWQINSYLNTKQGNRDMEQVDFLDPKAPSLARILKSNGYAAGHFGKWHMGGGRDVDNAPFISAYGFDAWHSTWESPDPLEDPSELRGDRAVPRHARTAFFIGKAIDFMKANKTKPFYMQLWLNQVHDPHRPSPEKMRGLGPQPSRAARTAADVEEMDAQLQALFDFLKAEGLEKNTIVVFTGDNGPNPSYDGERTLGLRGLKLSLYEGGLREPLIVRWPGHVPAGRVDETSILTAIDFLPTVAALTGSALPRDFKPDGIDASRAWLGTPIQRDKPIFWEYARNEDHPRPKEKADWSPNVAVRQGDWKLLVNAVGSGEELYNLAADPKETTNVRDKNPDVAKRLREQALAWRRSLP